MWRQATVVRFEVFTVVRMTMLFFWVVTSCRLVGRYQSSGETYCHFSPGNGNIMYLQVYTASQPRGTTSSGAPVAFPEACNDNLMKNWEFGDLVPK
jgi:hypothetical protein